MNIFYFVASPFSPQNTGFPLTNLHIIGIVSFGPALGLWAFHSIFESILVSFFGSYGNDFHSRETNVIYDG
jgi:hypothetical protein